MTSERKRTRGARGRLESSRAGRRRRTAIPAVLAALVFAGGCASAPKYAGSGRATIVPAEPSGPPGADSVSAIPFALLPPVRIWRCDRIKSPFGPRGTARGRAGRMHEGIDIETAAGEAILAAADGTVRHSGRRRGYGTAVIIDHSHGISTVYGHLSYLTVRPGRTVSAGEKIGGAGKRGRATGIHLHFELRRAERPIDPRPHLCLDSEARSP